MDTFQKKRALPRTVEEVVDLLIADLPPVEQETLRGLNDEEFGEFYQSVAESIINEFNLWTGNDELLASCLSADPPGSVNHDPSLIILEQMRRRLRGTSGILIIG
jgi:hypothetical protein